MKQNFEKVFPELLRNEGGFVNDPRDPGGATNLGITLKTAKVAGLDLDHDGDVDVDDVRLITPEVAAKVYDPRYWDAVKGDLLPSGVDYSMFDFGVHSGPSRAVTFLQGILGVTEDGILGNKTLAALANKETTEVIQRIHDTRLKYLKSLPTWPRYSKGWKSRVDLVLQTSLELATDTEASVPTLRPVVANSLFDMILQIILAIFRR